MAEVVTPYSGAMRLINTSAIPTWMNEYDASRIASYALYENIYWNQPQTFRLQQRGNEENPLYIPSGRIIVNTMDRYAGTNWTPVLDPAFGTEAEQVEALAQVRRLFKRERIGSQYDSNKLYGLIRGDWCWVIEANSAKAAGTRLTVRAIDPSIVFPIEHPDDSDRNLGVDLVEQIKVGEDLRIKRVRYLKSEHPDHPSQSLTPGGPISYQVDVLEVENWETEPKLVRNPEVERAAVLLNPLIVDPPIFLIKNFEEPQNPWGSSEMRGLERIFAGVNQSMTDEELTLALDGLGMYTSDKGRPTDEQGNPTNWVLGPGRVVHDETFKRVDGVKTVQPFIEHTQFLLDQAYQVNGASDVTRGVVDVSVAESGIALALRMGPIINSSKKKNTLIQESMDQFMYNLKIWFQVYEGVNMSTVEFNSTFDDPIPEDKQARFDNLMAMYTADPPLITAAYFRDACREMGMGIPTDVNGQAIADERAAMLAASDPSGARMDEELNNPTDEDLDAAPDEE